jgi:hypothetical protein
MSVEAPFLGITHFDLRSDSSPPCAIELASSWLAWCTPLRLDPFRFMRLSLRSENLRKVPGMGVTLRDFLPKDSTERTQTAPEEGRVIVPWVIVGQKDPDTKYHARLCVHESELSLRSQGPTRLYPSMTFLIVSKSWHCTYGRLYVAELNCFTPLSLVHLLCPRRVWPKTLVNMRLPRGPEHVTKTAGKSG